MCSGNDVDGGFAPVAVATNPRHRYVHTPLVRLLVNLLCNSTWFCCRHWICCGVLYTCCTACCPTNPQQIEASGDRALPHTASATSRVDLSPPRVSETLTMYPAEFNHVGERLSSFNSFHPRPIIHGLALLLLPCRQFSIDKFSAADRRHGTCEHSFRLVSLHCEGKKLNHGVFVIKSPNIDRLSRNSFTDTLSGKFFNIE